MNKADHETDKCNYRPISLLSVSGKIMESAVASSIMSHISDNNLSNPNQWAYKKDHCTELLLSKMTEDRIRELAFDSISHYVLLQTLQADRHKVTIVNGCCFCSSKVTLGVPQGSVLCPFLFSLFCNDLPDVVSDCDGELHTYADDTTI